MAIEEQIDFQKEAFALGFPGIITTHKETTFNYGLDILAIKKINFKLDLYGGMGFFRNKFNFSKYYNYQLLNPGDSIPLGLATKNYVYSLLRVPLGINYYLKSFKSKKISLSMENILNFSFLQIYNGAKTSFNFKNKMKKFKFYGDNFLIKINLEQCIKSSNCLMISPYIRIFNLYNHNDPVLYQNRASTYIRWVDAIGLSMQYSFNLKK
ncbi:MAG TPA: hypothetical protein VIJ95_06465 [Hanamia sp.]